jgi:hypothetical protein
MLDRMAAEIGFVVENEQIPHDEAVRRRKISTKNNAQPLDSYAIVVDVGNPMSWENLIRFARIPKDGNESIDDEFTIGVFADDTTKSFTSPLLSDVIGRF